jgi:hypothetical protein
MKKILAIIILAGALFGQKYSDRVMHERKCIDFIELFVPSAYMINYFGEYWRYLGHKYPTLTMDIWCQYYNKLWREQ